MSSRHQLGFLGSIVAALVLCTAHWFVGGVQRSRRAGPSSLEDGDVRGQDAAALCANAPERPSDIWKAMAGAAGPGPSGAMDAPAGSRSRGAERLRAETPSREGGGPQARQPKQAFQQVCFAAPSPRPAAWPPRLSPPPQLLPTHTGPPPGAVSPPTRTPCAEAGAQLATRALACRADRVVPYGYPLDEHFVTTSDGYILRLFRMPHGAGTTCHFTTMGPMTLAAQGA